MKKTEEKIIRFIESNKLIEKGERILVAFSGGGDSVFALHFLKKFQKKYKIEISAVHFNHQLRGDESETDEQFSEQFCQKLGVELFIFKLDVKKFAKDKKLSLEEAARKLRYQYIENLCKIKLFDKVVTAHNLSDNTETVLLNLLSGTSASGLGGIPIRRQRIIRPILCVTKMEILNYLDKCRIIYRVDSSNISDDFKRNYLRNRILPLLREKINPLLDEAVFRTTSNLKSQLSFNKKALEYFIDNFVQKKENAFEMRLNIIKVFEEIPGGFLKVFLEKNFDYEFKHDDFVSINSLAKNQKGKKINLGSGITVYKEQELLRFQKEEKEIAGEVELTAGSKAKLGNVVVSIKETKLEADPAKKKNYELISADGLNDKFLLRAWKHGDLFKPLGFKGTKKMSDFLTDIKIPSSERKNQLVLLNRNKIIWVVGLRISNEVKITNKTKRVYKLWTK
ncbi:MAG: cell cycle control ATPase [Ignavibacteria bacterium]|nr:MAG: cell cycle control ATPase [Ignavibacteria bacterium]KAF0155290.1 MAG: cell cycle control ATPase [Ignavibacteria bacterium]